MRTLHLSKCLMLICLAAGLFFTIKASAQNGDTIENEEQMQEQPNRLQLIQKDETSKVKHLHNGDFFLRYEIMRSHEEGSKTVEGWVAHFIPAENSRYMVEDQLAFEGYSYLDDNNMELWNDTIYSFDTPLKAQGYADELSVYTQLLEYYQTHQGEIEVLKDE